MTDRTTEALLTRRELAEKATPGHWYLVEEDADDLLVTSDSRKGMVDIAKCEMAHPEAGMDEPFASEQNANAHHIAANGPDIVIATIDEILRLRADVARLEREADWLATQLANALIDPALIVHLQYLSKGLMHQPLPEILREAARHAVEDE